MDMFEKELEERVRSEVAKAVEKLNKEKELFLADPQNVINAYHERNVLLEKQLEIKGKELEESKKKVGKFEKFLDSDGFLDVSEVAERISVKYIDPSGKTKVMGRTYFCKLLNIDRILLMKSSGYGLYSDCSKVLRDNSKIVSGEINGHITSSVKFNAKALDWLDDKYSHDERVWHSTGDKHLYEE